MFERAKERVAQKKGAAAAAADTASSTQAVPNGLILYHYPFSPVARRVVWYLTLAGIEYAECIQPPTKPRPDLESLNVNYRRIPVLAQNRSIYCDSRLILHKLSSQPNLAASSSFLSPVPATPEAQTLLKLLSSWTQDGGVFSRAAGLIPLESPVFKDERFLKDRAEFSGRSWGPDMLAKARGENLVAIKQAFAIVEGIFADDRQWVLGTEKPSLGDIEAIWPFDWLVDMRVALSPDYISEKDFPKTWAWIARFRAVVKQANGAMATPKKLDGAEARSFILGSTSGEPKLSVEPRDPLGLRQGDVVEVYPIDSGFGYKDKGRLLGLSEDEVTIAVTTKDNGGEIHLHTPRWGFRVAKAAAAAGGKL